MAYTVVWLFKPPSQFSWWYFETEGCSQFIVYFQVHFLPRAWLAPRQWCQCPLFFEVSPVSRVPCGAPPSPGHPCTDVSANTASSPTIRQGNTLKPLLRPQLCVNKPCDNTLQNNGRVPNEIIIRQTPIQSGSDSYTNAGRCTSMWMPKVSWWPSRRSVGVAPEANMRNPLQQGDRVCKWGLWKPKQTPPEVQNRATSGPTKRTDVLQIFFINNTTKKARCQIKFQYISLVQMNKAGSTA